MSPAGKYCIYASHIGLSNLLWWIYLHTYTVFTKEIARGAGGAVAPPWSVTTHPLSRPLKGAKKAAKWTKKNQNMLNN